MGWWLFRHQPAAGKALQRTLIERLKFHMSNDNTSEAPASDNAGGRVIRTAPAQFEADTKSQIAAFGMEGRVISIDELMILASPGQPANRLLREFALTQGHKAKDFDAALRKLLIREELGCVPQTPSEYVAALAKKGSLEVRLDGMIERHERPYFDNTRRDGTIERIYVDQFDAREAEAYTRPFREPIGLTDFRLSARVRAADLGLRFHRSDLDDAAIQWHQTARHTRRHDLITRIDHTVPPVHREKAMAALVELCRTTFDCSVQSPEYAAAALAKFIWQVRRKLVGLPVTRHAMVVLLGRQGTGKSTFVLQMIGPVAELYRMTDFKELEDNRNIDLWKSAVLFFDEMSWASKANIEGLKNAITAETLTRRPMCSNAVEAVPQRATFIGASNKEALGDLIRDDTGLRRFLALRYADQPDWEAINAFDWTPIWHAVEPREEDPMLPFREEVAAAQEAEREKNNVEQWLLSLGPRSFNGALAERTEFRATELYRYFREWEAEFVPAARSSVSRWGLDMKQLRAAGRCHFNKLPRRTAGEFYEYDGPPMFKVHTGGRA
jgi:hypothetical protein